MNLHSLDIVRRLAAETLDLPDGTLIRATTLQEAGIDSLATIDLVFAIEGHFGILIAPDDLTNMRSLNDLATSVDRLITHEARRHDA